MKPNFKITLGLTLFALPIAGLGVSFAANQKPVEVKAGEIFSLKTSLKLDWDGRTELSEDSSQYKNFTLSGVDKALSQRTAGTPLYLYDDYYNTFENPSPLYQLTPYSGYKAVQIRNYHDGGKPTDYYMNIGYGNKYDGSERDYGNFIEVTPLSSGYNIKSLTIKTRGSTSPENLWYRTSDDGENWTGDLTNTYRLSFNSSTKTYDLSFVIGVKYLRFYQNNNGDSNLRTAVTVDEISMEYESEGSIEVTFDAQNGGGTFSQFVDSGDHLIEPTRPTKSPINGHRYEFLGWFTEGGDEWDFVNNTVSSAFTLYAHWHDVSVSEYTVNYVSNGDESVDSETVGVGEYFTKPEDPVKTSEDPRYVYEFLGWYKEESLINAYDFSELPVEDITLYGKFTKSIAPAPSGTIQYNVKTYKASDSVYADAKPSYTEYRTRVMDSKQTFDYGNTTRPQIYLDVQGQDETSGVKKGGGTSEYDLVFRYCVVNLTWADNTKVLTFVRFQFHRINYQAYDSFNITMNVTGSEEVVSSCLAPGGKNTTDEDCVQASFTAEQNVTGITVNLLDPHIFVDMRYIVLGFADAPTQSGEEEAETFATNFLTAMRNDDVCGKTDERHDDNNHDAVEAIWSTWKSTFEGLDPQVIKAFNTSNNSTINEARVLYAHVVARYGLDTWENGPSTSTRYFISPALNGTTNNSALFVIFGVIALTTVVTGTVLLINKHRKEN